MKSLSKKYLLILILFTASAILSWHLYFKDYLQKDTVDINKFPKQIGEWQSEELPLTEEEYAILETHNIVSRRYRAPGNKEIYLLMVYSQSNRKVSHPPEICYTGGGVSILSSTHDFVPIAEKNLLIDANKLSLELRGARQIAFYWFKVGNGFTPNYWKQQGLIAIKSLLGQPSSSALIRIASDVKDEDDAATTKLIKDFTQAIVPDVLKYLP